MNKRIPSRNSRSKGIKVKHVLQICLLLGVFFWLVYQVKRSHDKKEEFDENDAKASIKAQSADKVLKFGRKDLNPRMQEAGKTEKHKEDEEVESVGRAEVNREEENKHEQEQEDDEEQTKHEEELKGGSKREEEDTEDENDHEEGEQDETKDEETEDEGRGGDDDIDESNQEKMDEKDGGEEEFIEEEKETEEVDEEKESENNEAEGKVQVEHEKSLEDQDHGGNSHEAREENYRADDASSAVTHDNPTTSTEGEKVGFENSDESPAKNDLEQENKSSENGAHEAQQQHYKAGDASSAVTHDNPVKGTESERVNSENSNTNLASIDLVQENKTSENNAYNVNGGQNNSTLHLEQGVMAENVLSGYNRDSGVGLANADDKSPPENTTSLFNDRWISSGKHLEVSTEAADNPGSASKNTSDLSQQNETLTISNPIHAQNSSVDGATIREVSDLKYTELEHTNSTDSDNSQSDINAVSFGKPEAINTIAGASANSSSSSVSDASDKTNKSEVEAAADANANAGSSSIIKEVTDATHNDNSNTNNESSGTNENSDSFATDDTLTGQDEKEARMNLDTLPKGIVGGINSRDTAAE